MLHTGTEPLITEVDTDIPVQQDTGGSWQLLGATVKKPGGQTRSPEKDNAECLCDHRRTAVPATLDLR